jgi:hypothetical protein
LNFLEKIKTKAFGNSRKKEKRIQPSRPSPAQPVCLHALSLRLTGGSHLLATARVRALSLPLSLRPVGPICRRCFSLSLCVVGPPRQRRGPFALALALSLSMQWDPRVSSVFPPTAADPRSRTYHGDRPHRSPTRPSSF